MHPNSRRSTLSEGARRNSTTYHTPRGLRLQAGHGHVCNWASEYLTYVYLNWYLLILLNIVAFLYGTHALLVVYYHRPVNMSW